MFNLYIFIVIPISLFFTITNLLEPCKSDIMCSSGYIDLSLQIISKFSASLIYPSMLIVFFTKFRYITTIFTNTFLNEIIDFSKLHKDHIYYGLIIWYSSIIHSIAHIVRLIHRSQYKLIIKNITGLSGVISLFLLFLIVPVMYNKYFNKFSYELKKFLHYLSLIYLIVLYFHKFRFGIFTISLLVLYLVDFILSLFLSTFKINDMVCHVLKRGVIVEFDIDQKDDFTGKIIYLNFPWLSIFQWHIFSIVKNYSKDKALVYIECAGDWTKLFYEKCYSKNNKPKMWISGPYTSPYSSYDKYKNIILISSGSGIIPSISIIENKSTEAKIHCIFISRDISLIKFFLPYFQKLDSYSLFYTGKIDKSIKGKLIDENTLYIDNSFVVTLGRPNICKIILEITNFDVLDQIKDIKDNGRDVSISFMWKYNINPYLDDFNNKLVMYCGGSNSLKKDIKEYCKLNHINCVFESFTQW